MTGDELFEWLKIHGKCCQCEGSLEDSKQVNMVSLDKKATWKHPTWGNVLIPGSGGRAVAIVCDGCVARAEKTEGLNPKFAIEIGSHQVTDGKYLSRTVYDYAKYHPVEDLEDTFPITEEMIRGQ